MVVYNTEINPNLTQDEIDSLINSLVLSEARFASISCLDGLVFGVTTHCNTCPDCEIFFNSCIRPHVISGLIASQEHAEIDLNYALTPRYITQKIQWDGHSRLRLNQGIETLGVSLVASAQAVPVSETLTYPIIEAVSIADVSGICIATLDGTIVKNPNQINFRNRATNSAIDTQSLAGYPRKVAGNWEVALGSGEVPPCSSTIDAYHCELIRVATPETTVTDGYIAPVYPGTNQIIPEALPSELINGDTDRVYWFYVYTLVNHAFKDEKIDLIAGEYYKLIDAIEFNQFVETTSSILVEYTEPSSTVDGDFTVTEVAAVGSKILNDQTGVVEVYDDPDELCGCSGSSCGCKYITAVTISYKTNPTVLGVDGNVTDVMDAIAHLTAAELPLSACDCDLSKQKSNFITKAQEAYTETRINPITGQVIHNLNHGNLYGQLVFSEKIDRLPKVAKISYM